MMSRPLITELPACGPSKGGNRPKTLRGPVGKERPAGPRSHIRGGMRSTAWFGEPTRGCATGSNHDSACSNFCLGRLTGNSQEGWTNLMVSDEPARSVVKRLRKAGFVKSDSRGSHTKWSHPESGAYVVVATGHRTISAGVVRRVNEAIKRSERGRDAPVQG
jgi:predicted RNA binding protein YcfA (HicA-like mRNA interferase family)